MPNTERLSFPLSCRRLLAGAGVLVSSGCTGEARVNESTWPADAPATIEVEGTSWSLTAEAWRSMQPGTGPRNDALLVLIRLSTSSAIPSAARVTRVQLRHGDDRVAAVAKEEMPREAGARHLELMVRDAPRWPIGDSITVLVQLAPPGGGTLTMAARAVIARVD